MFRIQNKRKTIKIRDISEEWNVYKRNRILRMKETK